MGKKSCSLACLILLVSCSNNYIFDESDDSIPNTNISPSIEKAFLYYIGHEDNGDTSNYYAIMFWKGEPGFPLEDTLIAFMRLMDTLQLDGYKGMIFIGDYKVVIIDKLNIGDDFYLLDSLENVYLKAQKSSPSNDVVDCCTFVLDGGSNLHLLGVQPDDYEPIEIERIFLR